MHARVELNFQANINGGRGEGSLMHAVVDTFFCFFFPLMGQYAGLLRRSIDAILHALTVHTNWI